jgi:hypothetical protein
MSILNELAKAIRDYPDEGCELEIVGYDIVAGPGGLPPGSKLNVGDEFEFRVKVSNKGPLKMTDVKVKVIGSAYADVGLDDATTFSSTALSSAYDIAPGRDFTTGPFRAKTKLQTAGMSFPIVGAQIAEWDAKLSNLLENASGDGDYKYLVKKIDKLPL